MKRRFDLVREAVVHHRSRRRLVAVVVAAVVAEGVVGVRVGVLAVAAFVSINRRSQGGHPPRAATQDSRVTLPGKVVVVAAAAASPARRHGTAGCAEQRTDLDGRESRDGKCGRLDIIEAW